MNVTVVPANEYLGYLSLWPTGQTQSLVSTLYDDSDAAVVANSAIVAVGTGGAISVYVTDPTHVILDINGYFLTAASSTGPARPQRPPSPNPNQIAILKWYAANTTTTFSVGHSPIGVAFDGRNIWVANANDFTVAKIQTSDGTILGTFPAGFSVKDVRHTYLTQLAENGTPESTMLALAGHMSRAMLERYSHIRMAAKRAAAAGVTLRPKQTLNSEAVPVKVPVSDGVAPVQ